MRKKSMLTLAVLTLTMGLNLVPKANAQTRPQDVTGRLTVWSFTDEVGNMLTRYVRSAYRNLSTEYSQTPTEQFEARLDSVFASGQGVPDIMALEAAFVRKYVESGQLLDLTDIYEANRHKLLAYPVEVGTHNGRVYALSWQATPGAMFYRRSLAKKYLGTDDPNVVQVYFANMNKFLESAGILSERSGGTCRVIAGPGELYFPYLSLRTNPWVVNGQLHIDPVVDQYLDLVKSLAENHYMVGGVEQWSNEWFAGMRGELKDWDGTSHLGSGRPLEVFAYFLPSWGLNFVLKTNAPRTSGDWAMIPGPVPYSWGGTWLAAHRNTSNPAVARELIRYLTTDNAFLERYARDSGDIVSNTEVLDRIKGNYRERFLGNQNYYLIFAEIAKTLNGRLIQANDQTINNLFIFNGELNKFLWEGKSKEQFLADFRNAVNTRLRQQ